MNKENYILVLFSFFVLSGVLKFCTHVLGLQDVNGEERTSFTLHTMGKTQKVGGVRATTTTLLRNRCVRETVRQWENDSWLTVCTFWLYDGAGSASGCCCGCVLLLVVVWSAGVACLVDVWCMASHSRVRLIYTLIVVVGCHGPTAGHHHIIGIDLWIVGIATAAYHHVVGIDLHIIVDRRLWRRRGRWRRRVAKRRQITFDLHVARQYQFRQVRFKFLHTKDWRIVLNSLLLL